MLKHYAACVPIAHTRSPPIIPELISVVEFYICHANHHRASCCVSAAAVVVAVVVRGSLLLPGHQSGASRVDRVKSTV